MISPAAPGPGSRLLTIVAVFGAGLAVLGVALAVDVPSPQRELNFLLRPYGILVPIAVGGLWWRRRPGSRTGPLLLALGLLAGVPALQLSGDPLLAQVGVATEAPILLLQGYLVLTFPTGRIRSRVERWSMRAMLVGVLLGLAALPLVPELRPIDYLSACGAACPPNPLYLGQLGSALTVQAARLAVIFTAVLITLPALLVYLGRWRAGNRRERAALLPALVLSLPVFPLRALNQAALLALALPASAFADVTWLLVLGRLAFPLGFLVALLRAEFLASRATAALVQQLSADRDRAGWAATIAGALDDPTVRVMFVAPGETAPAPEADRAWLEIRAGDGRPLAAISTNPDLEAEPELLEAVAAATRVAAETGELVDDVRHSRARLVDAADEERKRLGRDLHDSAQQRLVAMRIRLAIARDRLGADAEATAARLAEIEAELDLALDDLRSVARGLYPVLLARDGLAAALRSATRTSTVPTAIVDTGIARHPESVEAAAYFTCLEALQNVAKHAGARASATITLVEEDGTLVFTVRDDGVGFAEQRSDGIGLLTMRDRVAAAGGTLTIESRTGEGTTITGRIGGTGR